MIFISYDFQIQREMHMHKWKCVKYAQIKMSEVIKYSLSEYGDYFWKYSVIQYQDMCMFKSQRILR